MTNDMNEQRSITSTKGPSRRRLMTLGLGAAAGALVGLSARKAAAVLRLDITQGSVQPMPIALPDFVGWGLPDPAAARAVTQVITANLQRSGLFAPIEQTAYLDGLFAGLRNRGLSFGDVEPNPAAPPRPTPVADLIPEERIKRELHPLDAYPLLLQHAAANQAPDRENTFRFKWQGLFYLTPNREAYMARLRNVNPELGGVEQLLAQVGHIKSLADAIPGLSPQVRKDGPVLEEHEFVNRPTT